MTNTTPRDHSHQSDNLASLKLTSLKTMAGSLGISIDINDQLHQAKDSLTPLPRFKLVPLPLDKDGVFELELMAKADQWHIPYNKSDPDFFDLEGDVYDYEQLLKKTEGMDLDWDYSVYDPRGLEQAIEDYEDSEDRHIDSLRSDYNSTRGC